MDMSNLITAHSQLKQLRQQLDAPSEDWTPKSLEDWHDAVQTALRGCGINDNDYDRFNSIPPGQLKSFAIVRDDESSFSETHYGQSEVDDFLNKGINQSKQFLDAFIGILDKYIGAHYDEYREAVKAQIVKIIEKGPKR